jgi:transposase-like protein
MSFFEVGHLFLDEKLCIEFLLDHGCLYTQRRCSSCASEMRLMNTRGSWRCESRRCNQQTSIRANSFFSRSKLPCSKILAMAYFWVHRSKTTQICTMTGLSPNTVCDFQMHFRQLVAENLREVGTVIGGEGITVEIDESKLGKRKYNRGHHVEGVWVVGGIERTPEKRMFVVPVLNRCADTLIEVIRRHILPGTTVNTDMWRGYASLGENGYIHNTVNHSRCFVDPATGTHTNTIEGAWCGLKLFFSPQQRTREDMVNKLAEYLWRRQNKGKLWSAFLDALRDTHYDE